MDLFIVFWFVSSFWTYMYFTLLLKVFLILYLFRDSIYLLFIILLFLF